MKLPGWCQVCHRIRRVTVAVPLPGRVQVGICDDCQERQDRERRERRGGAR